MKHIITLIVFLICLNVQAQDSHFEWYGSINNIVTDSIIWQTTEVLSKGDSECLHEWAYSDEWRSGGNNGCLVMHYGWHCSWDDGMRNRICKACLRKEEQREQWYQHKYIRPETEYEKLEKELK